MTMLTMLGEETCHLLRRTVQPTREINVEGNFSAAVVREIARVTSGQGRLYTCISMYIGMRIDMRMHMYAGICACN